MSNIKNQQNDTKHIFLLITAAYIFSYAIRMIWIYQFQGNPQFYWNGELMINTNDGYFFASGAQKWLYHTLQYNPRVPNLFYTAAVTFSAFATKYLSLSLDTVILYMPAVVSSLVVIPIILIGRLFGITVVGFFAALLGSIAWSYYNRTMAGYFDTDMFSAMAPMFILYFLMKSTMDFTPKSALYAAIAIAFYPFLYDEGKAIIYAMGIVYALYMMFYHRNDKTTYISMILVFTALIPLSSIVPFDYIVKIVILIGLYVFLQRTSIEQRRLMIASGILFLLVMYFGNVFELITGKIMSYISTGTAEEGLHFYGVHQTIREAGKIPFETFANRISGSQIGLLLSLLGYIVLVVRYRAFLLALPLVGIGMFALWGGLRFTVYAVPVAAMSAIYLFWAIGEYFKDNRLQYLFVALATMAMIYPNITHIIGYKVPTVLNKAEVQDLEALNKIATDKDYTLTWWDYGYPIWFYSDTSTIIDGGKHQNDNFIISKIMQSASPDFAANFSRLAVETYIDSNYSVISNVLFKNTKKDLENKVPQPDPNLLLAELEDSEYKLPQKTRDIYLYLPYRMLRIFPTVMVFGNLDLTTGKKLRKIVFYPTNAVKQEKAMIRFANGIAFDTKEGKLLFGKEKKDVKNFIIVQSDKQGKTSLRSQLYRPDGDFAVVYMQSYGTFVVMDIKTFNSTYVQMFMLGKYDKNLFELVVSSPYTKIYKLQK